MKKISSIILCLSFILQFACVAYASTDRATAIYESETPMLTNFTSATCGYQIEATTAGGRNAAKLKTKSSFVDGTEYISFQLDTAFYKNLNDAVLEISVSYYDQGNGSFVISYVDRAGQNCISDIVYLKNTRTWKTQNFKLYNGLGNNAVVLKLYAYEMGQSKSDLIFDSFTIRKTNQTSPFTVKETIKTVGNMFTYGEHIDLYWDVNNFSDKTQDVKYKLTVYNSDNAVEKTVTGEKSFLPGDNTLNVRFPLVRCDAYQAALEIYEVSRNIYANIKTNFSVSVEAEKNEQFAVNMHNMTYTSREYQESIPLAKKMGNSMIREALRWNNYEKTKGKYQLTDRIEAVLAEAKANDMEVLLCLTDNNSLYYDKEYYQGNIYASKYNYYGTFPVGEAAVKAYGDFVYHAVSELRGKVRVFQIWNEFQSTVMNDFSYMEHFVALSKEAYQRAKQANPDCIVLGGSGFEVYEKCLNRFFEINNGEARDYMDALSMHGYDLDCDSAPEEVVKVRLDGYKQWIQRYKNAYGWESVPEVWITETGWTTAFVTEREQYEYLIRQYVMYQEAGFEKFFCYDFENDGACRTDRESSFGLTYASINERRMVPLSAKPAYVAMANMNKQLGNAVVTSYTPATDRTQVYEFTKEDGSVVWCLWNVDAEKEYSLSVKTSSATVIDALGNKETIPANNGVVNVPVSESPVYVLATDLPENDNIKVKKIDYNTGEITAEVVGIAQNATIMVLKPEKTPEDILTDKINALCYVGQANNRSSYEFTFVAEEEGTYTIWANVGGELVNLGTEFYQKEAITVTVRQGEKEITNMSDINKTDKLSGVVTFDNSQKDLTDTYLFVCGVYNGSRMVGVDADTITVADTQETASGEFEVALSGNEFDKIKVFLWRGETLVIPVIYNQY